MIPVTLFTDNRRIELAEAFVEPWSYRSLSSTYELLDVEIQDEDVAELLQLMNMDEDMDRRMVVVSLGGAPSHLAPAELRLEDSGRLVVTIGDRETIEFAKALRAPITLEGEG
jgi:hypothetical protein